MYDRTRNPYYEEIETSKPKNDNIEIGMVDVIASVEAYGRAKGKFSEVEKGHTMSSKRKYRLFEDKVKTTKKTMQNSILEYSVQTISLEPLTKMLHVAQHAHAEKFKKHPEQYKLFCMLQAFAEAIDCVKDVKHYKTK